MNTFPMSSHGVPCVSSPYHRQPSLFIHSTAHTMILKPPQCSRCHLPPTPSQAFPPSSILLESVVSHHGRVPRR